MNKLYIFLTVLFVGTLIYFLWPKNDANITTTGEESVKIFVDFRPLAQATNCLIIHQGNLSQKPTYYKQTDIQDFSPTFNPASEGLHYIHFSNRDLFSYIFIRKGGEYHIKPNTDETTFKGTDSKLNYFLLNYQNYVNQLTQEFLPAISSLKNASPTSFVKTLNEMQAAHKRMLDKQGTWLTEDIKSKLIEDYKDIRKMVMLTFLDKKYTNKQANTALKYTVASDFSDEKSIMQSRDYARASAQYFALESLTAKSMKRSSIKAFYDYLMEKGISTQAVERICMEMIIKDPRKFRGQENLITSNQYLLTALSCADVR
jgi:hypothetical protein